MDPPIGRNRVGDEHDGDVCAAEKQRIMASAALSPGAPSSFLVRALLTAVFQRPQSLAEVSRCSSVEAVSSQGGVCASAPRPTLPLNNPKTRTAAPF